MTLNLTELKFPIGQYQPNRDPSPEVLSDWIDEIAMFPSTLSKLISNLSEEQMNWCYRPGGWNCTQLVHHCADSHMNAFIRFKLALTEKQPTIKPYREDLWVQLPDADYLTLELSIGLLEYLHAKWVILLKSLSTNDMKKEYEHPEHGEIFNLAETIGNYAWHCEHHLAHVRLAIESDGKYNMN